MKHINDMSHVHENYLSRYPNYEGAMKNGVAVISQWEPSVEDLMKGVREAVWPMARIASGQQ